MAALLSSSSAVGQMFCLFLFVVRFFEIIGMKVKEDKLVGHPLYKLFLIRCSHILSSKIKKKKEVGLYCKKLGSLVHTKLQESHHMSKTKRGEPSLCVKRHFELLSLPM